MMKSIKTMLREDKERYTVPRRVQDVIPVRRIWNDGIFMVGGRFAKTLSSFTWELMSRSPISSRKMVPPSAAANRPSRSATAPVKAPFL